MSNLVFFFYPFRRRRRRFFLSLYTAKAALFGVTAVTRIGLMRQAAGQSNKL